MGGDIGFGVPDAVAGITTGVVVDASKRELEKKQQQRQKEAQAQEQERKRRAEEERRRKEEEERRKKCQPAPTSSGTSCGS